MTSLLFRLAAAANILGILAFSLAFTNQRLVDESPVVFSRFGIGAVMLWGLAYWSVAGSYQHVPKLVAVFAIEKLVYVITWIIWMIDNGHRLGAMFADDPLTAAFYANYGLIDLAFGLVFAATAWRHWLGSVHNR